MRVLPLFTQGFFQRGPCHARFLVCVKKCLKNGYLEIHVSRCFNRQNNRFWTRFFGLPNSQTNPMWWVAPGQRHIRRMGCSFDGVWGDPRVVSDFSCKCDLTCWGGCYIMSVFAGSPSLLSQNYIASLWLHRAGEKRRGEGPVRLRDCYDITGCPQKWLFSRQKDSGVPNVQTNPYCHCSMYLGLLINSYLCQACITSTGMMPKMIRPFVVPNVIMCLIYILTLT